jgi:Raf kinase inhibitor-like YbhB/YbcL family protein
MRIPTRLILSSLLTLAATPALANNKTTLTVTSTAFQADSSIPSQYACDGAGESPPLSWSNVPADAKSIAILAEDPNAPKGTFTHWLVTNIPPSETSLSAGGSLPTGAAAMRNSKGTMGYTPPCPPSGTHHYRFHVYALDKTLAKPASRDAFMKEIKGHVLAEGELVGTYQKQN